MSAWRMPFTPGEVRMHSTIRRVAASMNSTCPVATNETTTCDCDGLTAIMCGRIG